MVHFCQKKVISETGCYSIRYIHKTQRLLGFLAVIAVTAALLVGCAESGALSLVPDQATQKPDLTLGQTVPALTSPIPGLTSPSPVPAPDSTTQYDQVNIGTLDLRQRSPDSWEVVDSGASGTLTYHLSGPRFVFEFYGERLEAETSYSLIYYAASELGPVNLHSNIPGDLRGALIAEGISHLVGNIHLQGSINLGMDLPYLTDANYECLDCSAEYGPYHGAKIWLVPSDCYNSTSMTVYEDKWQPERFLFETKLITYFVTNGMY